MSNRDFNTNTENKEEWLTPPEIITSLGCFDLDPCAPTPEKRPWATATNHYSILDDGLNKQWDGRVWCNPPYGKETFTWLNRLASHKNGIALIFARTETIGFHREIWDKADAIFFFKGRIKFYHVNGIQGDTANAPSCLIAYGDQNVEALRNCGMKGRFIKLSY
jgi:hypothetical protein